MTQEDRKARKQAMLADIKSGMPAAKAAAKHGLTTATARTYASKACIALPSQPPREPRAWARKSTAPLPLRGQKANLRAAKQAHAEWRLSHILLCAQFPEGPCCAACHSGPVMELLGLPGGKHAHICCSKARANGYRTQLALDRRATGALSRREDPKRQ